MKVGDRVMFRSEPAYVVGFLTTRHAGWVLIERGDGSRCFARAHELHLVDEKDRPK